MRTGPLDLTLDFPYHPHVTVAHEMSEPHLDRAFTELDDFEARFDCDSFWLYIYDEAPGWVPKRCFTLNGSEDR